MKVDKQESGDQIFLSFSGAIDEDSIFPPTPKQKKVSVDLENIERVNSCGIREWVSWFKGFSQNQEVFLQNCKKVIIDQVNAVDGFLISNARVLSFYVPYYCDGCGHLTSKKLEVKKEMPKPEKAIECEKCKKQAELDVLPQKYFRFLEFMK